MSPAEDTQALAAAVRRFLAHLDAEHQPPWTDAQTSSEKENEQ